MKWPKSRNKASAKPKSRKKRKPFRQRLISVLPVLVGALALTLLYSDTPLFRKLETTALDLKMLSRAHTEKNNVVIVAIDEPYYQDKFGGKSPLDPSELKKVIEAMGSARPKVIGIDIDTS